MIWSARGRLEVFVLWLAARYDQAGFQRAFERSASINLKDKRGQTTFIEGGILLPQFNCGLSPIFYGRENAADEFSAGLPNYATHSTAKSYQSTAPRDLNEQTLWNRVIDNPSAGRDTKLAGDKDFPRSEGWRKMEVSHRLPSGENITVHYQYNSVTGKAYDMKITTPQQLPPALQPGRTIE